MMSQPHPLNSTPPEAASSTELPFQDSSNQSCTQQTPPKCNSSGWTVRLPQDFGGPISRTELSIYNEQTLEQSLLLTSLTV